MTRIRGDLVVTAADDATGGCLFDVSGGPRIRVDDVDAADATQFSATNQHISKEYVK